MNNEETLYEILQVSQRAEQEVIQAAYRRLAMKYHPDVNRSNDATDRMRRINYAYEILKNPTARADYDQQLRRNRGGIREETEKGEEDEAEETEQAATQENVDAFLRNTAPTVSCQVCGVIDSTIRLRVHPYVVSALVLAFRRASLGVLCEKCARKIAWRNSIISLLIGTWGIPFGFFWTVSALFTNARGGSQPGEINAELLSNCALLLLYKGYAQEAARAARASLTFVDNDKLRNLLNSLANSTEPERTNALYWGSGSVPRPELLGTNSGLLAIGAVATLIVVFAWIAPALSSLGPTQPKGGTAQVAVRTSTPTVALNAQPKPSTAAGPTQVTEKDFLEQFVAAMDDLRAHMTEMNQILQEPPQTTAERLEKASQLGAVVAELQKDYKRSDAYVKTNVPLKYQRLSVLYRALVAGYVQKAQLIQNYFKSLDGNLLQQIDNVVSKLQNDISSFNEEGKKIGFFKSD